MAHDLYTLITALLPPTGSVRLTEVTVEQASVRIQLMATAPTAACPYCAMSSSSIHRLMGRVPLRSAERRSGNQGHGDASQP